MNLPFGLNLVSVLVGMALVWFVIPWVLGVFNRQKPAQQPVN